MALTDTSTKLGCGRDIDEVWDHLNQAPDSHELSCQFCRAARADLTGLQQATTSLRAAETTNPELEPSPQLLDRILAVAHAEVRRGRRIPLDRPGPDQTTRHTISEQAVTAVIWRAADLEPGMQVRRCRIELDEDSSINTAEDTGSDTAKTAVVDVPPGSVGDGSARTATMASAAVVAVFLRVSVGHGSAIAAAANQLRTAVIQAVTREVGVQVSNVSIEVEDLHDA